MTIQTLFPRTAEEAMEVLSFADEDTGPTDCHVHCHCYDMNRQCCDCGENKGPVQQLTDGMEKAIAELEDGDAPPF
jgi:hypothetical protein